MADQSQRLCHNIAYHVSLQQVVSDRVEHAWLRLRETKEGMVTRQIQQ